MMDAGSWILASGSPRRRELLARLIPEFTVVTADVMEWEPDEADPAEQVEENARRKGVAVSTRYPRARVIAADTTVALDGRLFAKPADLEEARGMLLRLSGRSHQVLTGVALVHGDRVHCFHETSTVVFKELDETAIEDYLKRVHVLDKAGAYAIQEHGDRIIERYEGSFENIMGLPVQRLGREWVQLGWVLPRESQS